MAYLSQNTPLMMINLFIASICFVSDFHSICQLTSGFRQEVCDVWFACHCSSIKYKVIQRCWISTIAKSSVSFLLSAGNQLLHFFLADRRGGGGGVGVGVLCICYWIFLFVCSVFYFWVVFFDLLSFALHLKRFALMGQELIDTSTNVNCNLALLR